MSFFSKNLAKKQDKDEIKKETVESLDVEQKKSEEASKTENISEYKTEVPIDEDTSNIKKEVPQSGSDFEERPFFEPEESDYMNIDEEFSPDVSGWKSKTDPTPKKSTKEDKIKTVEKHDEYIEKKKDLKEPLEAEKSESKEQDKVEKNEPVDDGTLQNEEGEKMFDKIVEGNPLLQFSKDNFYIKFINKKMIFTPKNSEEDFIFNSSKKELTEKLNEIVGGGASIEIRSSNEGMQKVIDLFGDKLEIRE